MPHNSQDETKQDNEIAGKSSLVKTISIDRYQYEHPYFGMSDLKKKQFIDFHTGHDSKDKK